MRPDRVLGDNGIQVSISTALALEALVARVDNKPQPISACKELWINLRTLIRNIKGAYEAEAAKNLTYTAIHQDLVSEVNYIDGLIQQHTKGQCKVIFYCCSLASLPRKFPTAQLKVPKTPLQQANHAAENAAISMSIPMLGNVNFRPFDVDITGSNPTSFILTHMAVDLLSSKNFERLALVESHTGVIKPPSMWYTKLTNGNEMPTMPFNRFTLQVFGDRGICFNPLPIKLKTPIIEMAKQYNWTPATTKDKILFGIKALGDPMGISFFTSLW